MKFFEKIKNFIVKFFYGKKTKKLKMPEQTVQEVISGENEEEYLKNEKKRIMELYKVRSSRYRRFKKDKKNILRRS